MKIVPEGAFVYGIQLPVQAQSSLFVEDWERDSGAAELVRIARKAEECGLFYVAVCDHIAIPDRLAAPMGTVWYDTIATLGMLAGVTERIRLLSHVWVLAYRHPLQSAKSFATLDRLSDGRVIAGVGAGHVAEEFAMLGLDFEQRGRLLDAALPAFRTGLSGLPVDGATVGPAPVQSTVPVWIGGSSNPALRRVAAHGDGWLPQGTPRAKMPQQIAYLRDHLERARPGDNVDVGAICEFLYVGEPGWDVGRGVVNGSPARLAESILEFRRMGVDHLQIRFKARSCDELCDQLDAFAAEVAPLVEEGA